MKKFKPIKFLFGKFFKAIDTITTKLLILVLCCVTIPLFVVANFSANILNQSSIYDAETRLNISKNIFLKLYSNKINEVEIKNSIKEITGTEVRIYTQKEENKEEINKENTFSKSFTITNPDNQLLAVHLLIPKDEFLQIINENGRLIGFIAIISLVVAITIAAFFARTITDPILFLAEAAESINLGDLNYKIELKGNDETVKLANSFNKMVNNLEREERLRNNFVATLTHDLKVPMLAENQTVSYLLKETYGPLTSEQKEVLELIKSTNTSSLEMIGTLLEVYRYDAGNVTLFETDFDIVELIKESINQIKSLGVDKKIEINVSSNRDFIKVKADKRDIKRVIHNLISNSIYHGIYRGFINCHIEAISDNITYNPANSTENYTTLHSSVNISNNVLISIEDNGVGIAREDMNYLFKRFALGKGRKPSGSGLGLYYSYQVISMHKGYIWAESSEKGGSTFKFTIPINLG